MSNHSGILTRFSIILRELRDFPSALLQQYRQQPAWVLSAAGDLPREYDQLEARLRRESYRRQFFNILKAALFIALFIIAVYLHGYLYTVYTIHQSGQEFGIYPTLNEAIQSLDEHFERYYSNIKSVSITTKGPIKSDIDFIWEVHADVYAEKLADGRPMNHRHSQIKIYYIHTKSGWVPYEKETWMEVGFLPHWMKFYHLYGE